MARSRNIKPSFFINENLVELSFETRLLFVGLWTLCDREGYLEDKPKKIKMALFPADDVNVNQMLDDLQKEGFLIRYTALNRKCIFLPKFTKHQNPHYKEAVNDVPRFNPSLVSGKPETNPSQEQEHDFNVVSVNENQEYINDLNTSTYGVDNQSLGQALDKPQSNRADILIPDSFNLIPDCGNLKDDSIDPRFNISLSEVNTKLQMGGLKAISQEELTPLIVKLHSAYPHKKQMVKNQILGKAFEWVERQQKTPLATPKPQTPANQDKWNDYFNNMGQPSEELDVTPKKLQAIEGVGHA